MATESYGLSFKLKPTLDEQAVKSLEVSLKKVAEAGFGSDKLTKDMRSMLELETKAKEIRKEIERYSALNSKEAKQVTKALQKELNSTIKEGRGLDDNFGQTKVEQAIAKTGNVIADIALKVGDKLIDVTKSAWEEMKNMASYSRLSNAHTRDLAFSYGFSSSQAYGYDKAMSMLGYSSMEDLMYASDSERQMFQRVMTKYAEKYTQLYDSGFYQKQLEYDIEVQELKQDLQLELVEFFMSNKDEIKTVMTVIVKTGEFLIQALGWIVSNFGGAQMDNGIIGKSESVSNVYSPRSVQVENTLNISGDTSKQTRDAYTYIMDQIASAVTVLGQ